MRFIKYALLAIIAVLLVTLATANLEPVTVKLMPSDVAAVIGLSPELNVSPPVPLFVVILASVVLGVLLGYLAEWFREHKFRAAASRNKREADKLSSELKKMKSDKNDGDDVLALLDEAGSTR
ncbi:MAG: LapA family protein [Pseudomonadota bacterium]